MHVRADGASRCRDYLESHKLQQKIQGLIQAGDVKRHITSKHPAGQAGGQAVTKHAMNLIP